MASIRCGETVGANCLKAAITTATTATATTAVRPLAMASSLESRVAALRALAPLLRPAGEGSQTEEEQQGNAECNTLRVDRLLKLIRVADPEVLDALFRDVWLRPLCVRAFYSDAFILKLMEHARAEIDCVDFARLWADHSPRMGSPVPAKERVALREVFNAVSRFGRERLSEERDENSSHESKATTSARIRLLWVLDALEAKIEVRALASTCEWLLDILTGDAFQALSLLSSDWLDFEEFIEFLQSCEGMEQYREQNATSLGPLLAEIVVTNARDDLRSEWPIAPFSRVTHFQVCELASKWGVDVAKEPHLLWVLRQALDTKLPSDWELVKVKGEATPGFRNVVTGQEITEHPAHSYFQNIIRHERQQMEQLRELGSVEAKRDPSRAWMEFSYGIRVAQDPKYCPEEKASASTKARAIYYFNFATNVACTRPPEQMQGFVLRDDNGLLSSKVAQSFQVRQTIEQGAFAREQENKAEAKPNKASFKAFRPDKVTTLQFRSWWTDGSFHINERPVKRYIDLYFHVESGSAQVLIEGTEKVYTFSHLVGKRGKLQAWDLHVGAQINILGRKTTLMQANAVTTQYIESYRKTFASTWAKLRSELVKYDPSLKSCPAVLKVREPANASPSPGKTSLRAYLQDIEMLGDALAAFRPKRAAEIRSGALSLIGSTDSMTTKRHTGNNNDETKS